MKREKFIDWLLKRREVAERNNAERGGDALRVILSSVELEQNVQTDRDADMAMLGYRLAMAEAGFSRDVFAKDAGMRHRRKRDDAAVNAERDDNIAAEYVHLVGGDPANTPSVVRTLARKNTLTVARVRGILKKRGVFLASR